MSTSDETRVLARRDASGLALLDPSPPGPATLGDQLPQPHDGGVGGIGDRVGELEAGQQAIRDVAGVLHAPQPGHQDQVLSPGEDLVHGRELPGEADGLSHVRRVRGDVEAIDRGCPRVGLEQVDRIFTTVVLPAPLEPSKAKMPPRATSKSTPRSTCSSSYDFSRACTWIPGARTCSVVIWMSMDMTTACRLTLRQGQAPRARSAICSGSEEWRQG